MLIQLFFGALFKSDYILCVSLSAYSFVFIVVRGICGYIAAVSIKKIP